jgi:hypothetical protein
MTTKITMSDAATDKKTAMKDKKQESVLLKHPPEYKNLILFSNRFTLLIINYLENRSILMVLVLGLKTLFLIIFWTSRNYPFTFNHSSLINSCVA